LDILHAPAVERGEVVFLQASGSGSPARTLGYTSHVFGIDADAIAVRH
jgi:hypothetical protein